MIRDPYHTHLNATRWTTLGEFLHYLCGKSEGQDFMLKRELVSGIETDMILLVDKERLLSQQQESHKLTTKELEKKREIKQIEKRIKMAHKLEQKLA
jgi:hypothetical protein